MTWLIAAKAGAALLMALASVLVLRFCWQADRAGQIRMTTSRRRQFLKEEEPMKKALVVLALLFSAATIHADDWMESPDPGPVLSKPPHFAPKPCRAVTHDCRISRIEIKVTRRQVDGWYHLAATFVGHDGRGLDPARCPDQNRPSWSVVPYPEDMRFSDALGYHFIVLVPPGPVTVDTVTVQGFQVNNPVYPRGRRRFIAR